MQPLLQHREHLPLKQHLGPQQGDCAAADSFAAANPEYVVRKTGLNDRIVAFRFYSGIPFYAYKGTKLLRDFYNQGASADYGIGAHLYARTGRGKDGSGDRDWRSFLPIPGWRPTPSPEEWEKYQRLEKLYNTAEEKGIIQKNADSKYVLIRSTAPEDHAVRRYDLNDAAKFGGTFTRGELVERAEYLRTLLRKMHDPESDAIQIYEFRGADDPKLDEKRLRRCRIDYLGGHPLLMKAASEELEKVEKIEEAIASIEELVSSLLFEKEIDVLTLWDSANKRYLYVYKQYGCELAYDQANKEWVKVDPKTMFVYTNWLIQPHWDVFTLEALRMILN